MTRKEEFLQRIKNIEKSDFKKVIDKQLTLEEMAKIYNMDVKTIHTILFGSYALIVFAIKGIISLFFS